MENVTITQAAEILGVTRKTVYNMQKRGELPDPITEAAIMDYLEKQASALQHIRGRLGEYLSGTKIRVG